MYFFITHKTRVIFCEVSMLKIVCLKITMFKTIFILFVFTEQIVLPMLKIELSKLKFHGFHGVHEEETKTGGDFEVDVVVYFTPETVPVRHLDETIDYTQLYEL